MRQKSELPRHQAQEIVRSTLVSFPDPTPTWGKGSGVLRAISWASRMQNSHVILIIVMATHCLVCGSHMQQHCGLICAAGVLSHKKSHAVNLIGAPEIRTAMSSSPRNCSKYTRPSSPCRGGVWDRDYIACTRLLCMREMLHICVKLEHAYIRNVNVHWTDRQTDRRTDRHDHRLTDHVGLTQARPNYAQVNKTFSVINRIQSYCVLHTLQSANAKQ